MPKASVVPGWMLPQWDTVKRLGQQGVDAYLDADSALSCDTASSKTGPLLTLPRTGSFDAVYSTRPMAEEHTGGDDAATWPLCDVSDPLTAGW